MDVARDDTPTPDADGGVPPDGWSFIPEAELQEKGRSCAVDERMAKWRPEGMTWARFTDLTGEFQQAHMEPGIWIEVWKAAPAKEAAFHPPLTAADTASSAPRAGPA
jgi:hypothetical protein